MHSRSTQLLPRGVTSLARSITEHQLQLVAVKLTKGNASGIIYHGEECLALTAQGMHTTLSKVSHEGHFCGHIHSSLASGQQPIKGQTFLQDGNELGPELYSRGQRLSPTTGAMQGATTSVNMMPPVLHQRLR